VEKFRQFWRRECRAPEGVKVLAAVSGGADSVALLHLLTRTADELGLYVYAAHVHHGLRGAEADEDAAFTDRLCRDLQVPLQIAKVNVNEERRRGESVEEAARRVRYRELAECARKVNAAVVVTGHTADDLVETVLFHLARGSGPLGLAGIRPTVRIAGCRVVRPMLDCWHEELCDYLRAEGLSWREDSSNRDLRFMRNRIRRELIPWLESNINPAARRNIARLARIVAREEEWLGEIAANLLQSCSDAEGRLLVPLLRGLPEAARRRAIASLLNMSGAPVSWGSVERIQEMVEKEGGEAARVDIGAGWVAVREADIVSVVPPGAPATPMIDQEHFPGGQTPLPEVGLYLSSEWVTVPAGRIPVVRGRIGEYPAEVYLDGARCEGAIFRVRSWRPGDRMRPVGSGGSRKLQDIFTDLKVPRYQRPRIPVLEAAGEVVWVAGYRPAAGWEARGGRMLHLRVDRLP